MEDGEVVQILKEDQARTIPAKFSLIWFSIISGEDLNVKVYDVQRTMMNDGCQVMAKALMTFGQVI